MYQRYSVLTRFKSYYPLVNGSVHASAISTPWGAYKQGPVGAHCFLFTEIHALSSQVPIYTPVSREAIDIKHFAKECKHGDPARI